MYELTGAVACTLVYSLHYSHRTFWCCDGSYFILHGGCVHTLCVVCSVARSGPQVGPCWESSVHGEDALTWSLCKEHPSQVNDVLFTLHAIP